MCNVLEVGQTTYSSEMSLVLSIISQIPCFRLYFSKTRMYHYEKEAIWFLSGNEEHGIQSCQMTFSSSMKVVF